MSCDGHSLGPGCLGLGCLGLNPDSARYSCVALGKLVNLSVPNLFIFEGGIMMVLISQGDGENEMYSVTERTLTGPGR